MDSPYDADDGYDDWVPTDIEDGSNIVGQGTEQSVTGDGDQENFDINELEVLVRRRKDWKESGKTKKPMILQSILGELHELDKNTELSHAEMQLKAGLVTAWLKKPLRARKPQITLRSRYRYSVQLVVWELYHDLVQRKLASMREDTGNEESTKQIGVYQQALTVFMQEDLIEEQLAAAEAIADKWNGMEGPTPEIKARSLETQQDMGTSIAAILQKRCGGIVACGSMDFNRDIADGTSFNEVQNLEGPWWDYLGEAFEDSGISDEDEDGQGDRWPGKKAARTVKVDAVSLVTNEDGTVSIGEITGLSRDLLQKTVRGFMTAHYRRACGKATSTVPFKQLGTHQKAMIVTRHLPPNFSFTIDPSHMSVAAATELLSFWHQRQDKNTDDVFHFEKWLDQGGKLQPPAVDSGIPIQIVRDWRSRSRTPATAPAQSKAPAGRTQRSDWWGNGKGSANTVQPNVQGSDMDDFERASPVIFEGVDMPGPSHDWHGHVTADVETDHDDDPLDDGWPQANQRHKATPFPRKTTAPIRPDDVHQKDTHQVRNKTPFLGRAMKETNTSYVEEEASNSDEVDRSEGLGAADELPTLAKWRPAELIEFTTKIKDGSEHQGGDHLQSLPIAQDAPPNPVGRGNKQPEDVAQPHSATASKGHRIPLQNGKVHIRQIEARGEDPLQSAGPSRRGQKAGTIRRLTSHGRHSQMPEHLPPQPRLSEVSASMVDPFPPPPPPPEDDIPPPPPPPEDDIPPPPPPPEDDIPPPLPPPNNLEVMAEEVPPPQPSEASDDSEEQPPLPQSDEDETDNALIPPPPPSSQGSDSHHSVTSLDGNDTHMSTMDTDITLELPVQPPSNDTRFLAEDISNPQVPILEDQPDVLFRAEWHRLQQKFTRLCSAWMGHDLSDEEKWEMEVHGFMRPGADHAIYWAVHQLRLTHRPVWYHFPFHPNDQFDPAVADAMAQTATDFAYVVLRRMDLWEEAERSLRQITDLDTFYDPFTAIGLQRFAAQPRYLARQSVMDMIFMYMSCRIDTAIRHLVQLPTVATWPAHWYRNLCIDMSTLDCLIPIAVTQNCYRLLFPTSYMLQHMGGWTEETFRNALSCVPEAQMSNTCSHVMELLPQWTLHLQEDVRSVLPWWLMAALNYASDSHILCSDEVQTIAQRYFRDLWPPDKSPIKDRLHGTLESWVESYMNIARRVEVLLPDLNAEVEELFERLTCMAQMLGLYTDGARCELCTCVE
ncbi:hypothetical protein BKA82DRAFT_34875 [Pisolithus tinctorius]|nr:hypothetical protein BKA82DRAFT_34875 [Pisolithus tinctorius]